LPKNQTSIKVNWIFSNHFQIYKLVASFDLVEKDIFQLEIFRLRIKIVPKMPNNCLVYQKNNERDQDL